MVNVDLRVRPAVYMDQRQIANLIHFEPHVHRHLDWRNPLDWIGSPPYLVIETDDRLVAALACPPDPPRVAWIRLFVNAGSFPLRESWTTLWEAARGDLKRQGNFVAAAIALQDWYKDLLDASGFTSRQQIVMLKRDRQDLPEVILPKGISIRPMMPYDLPTVAEVDAAAFANLWQNSLPALSRAYPQTLWATVAESEQGILGYQISTKNPFGCHLARLAVRPEAQGRGVGTALVTDLIHQMVRRSLYRLTVNTQDDNTISFALYRKIGFRETSERYPVYEYPVE